MLDVYSQIETILRKPPSELFENDAYSGLLAIRNGTAVAAITTTYRYFGGEPMLRIPGREGGVSLDDVVSAIISVLPGACEQAIEWHGYGEKAFQERAIIISRASPIKLYVKDCWEYDHSFYSFNEETGRFERFIFDRSNHIVSMKREVAQRIMFSGEETRLVREAFRKTILKLFGPDNNFIMYFLIDGLEHLFDEAIGKLSKRFSFKQAAEVMEVVCADKDEYREHAPIEKYQKLFVFHLPDGDPMIVLVETDECGQPLMLSRQLPR